MKHKIYKKIMANVLHIFKNSLFTILLSDPGKSISESGLGDGAFISGDGMGLLNVGSISSSFFLTFLILAPNVLYA